MFFNAISSYLNAWKHIADFAGYTSRKAFWLFMLVHSGITLCFIVIDILVDSLGWFDLIYSVASFIPMIAIMLRRLHDIGQSGWWIWVFMVPAIGPFWLIYLFCQQSEHLNKQEGALC